MNSTQDSFVFCTNPPKSEEHHYLKQIKTEKINLIFDDEGIKRTIPYSPETTIREALREFIKKFKPNEIIENFDFQIAGSRLDINSEEKVGKKFMNNAYITVLDTKLLGG